MNAGEFGPSGGLLSADGTGDIGQPNGLKTVACPFGRYRVLVRVTGDGRFVGVEAVEVDADFVTCSQKAALPGYHDVSAYYTDD